MNFNPFQGDSPDVILKYGWLAILELAVVWSLVSWVVGWFFPKLFSWVIASWVTLAYTKSLMDSPLSNPANVDKSWGNPKSLFDVPDHWDKSTDWHTFPSGWPLIAVGTIITIIWYVIV